MASREQGYRKDLVTAEYEIPNLPGFWNCLTSKGRSLTIHEQYLEPMANIPLKYRQTTFDRFARVIGSALNAYPSAIKVDPAPLKVDSYCQPLRDAITAKQRFGYKNPAINEDLFKRHADDLVVAADDSGHVWVGPAESVKARKAVAEYGTIKASAAPVANDPEIVVDHIAVATICNLLKYHRLKPTPNFVVLDFDPQTIVDLESSYDVVFVPHEKEKNKHSLVGPIEMKLPETTTT